MRWIEFIKIQTDFNSKTFTNKLTAIVEDLKKSEKLAGTDVFVNVASEGDMAVLLEWDSESAAQNGSFEGNIISDFLKKNGLTNYSIWKTVDKNI